MALEDLEGLTLSQIKDVLVKTADDLDLMIDKRQDHNLMKPKVITLHKLAEKLEGFTQIETK
jgi:hypothetical protein